MNTKPGAWMVIYCAPKKSFLLGRRGPQMSKPLMWNFFGGHLDPGESAQQGVVRELREEAGLEVALDEILHIGAAEVPLVGYVSGLRELHYFLLITDREIEPRLDHEHSEYRWFRHNALPHAVNRPTAVGITIGLVQKAMHMAEEQAPIVPLTLERRHAGYRAPPTGQRAGGQVVA